MNYSSDFSLLSPQIALNAVESAFGLKLTGTLMPYVSYVNRVYGITDQDRNEYVVKFYRPNRWNRQAIEEEHLLLLDCYKSEVPVVTPISNSEGITLHTLRVDNEDNGVTYFFAVFPKQGGRSFDTDRLEDYFRLGSLIGRMHQVSALRPAHHRLRTTPKGSTENFVTDLIKGDIIHPAVKERFIDIVFLGLDLIKPNFEGVKLQRIHGDCHRGNILDRVEEGLLIIDFDDMMMGSPVQDLWLLLPDRLDDSKQEVEEILRGYEQFKSFDRRTLSLIEPLRFMRMVYFLAWSANQRNDYDFKNVNPFWGSKSFWEQESEDFSTQIAIIRRQDI